MRHILLITAAIAAFPTFAQKELSLASIEAPTLGWKTTYSYDDNYRVIRIGITDSNDPMQNQISVLKYDDRGNQTRMDLYQDINCTGSTDESDYRHNAYIDFRHDEENRLVERINYNNVNYGEGDPVFILGGVIVSDYDDNGRLSQKKTYWDLEKTDLFQEILYAYDQFGFLDKTITYMQDFFTGEMKPTEYEQYIYDIDSHVLSKEKYAYDEMNQALLQYTTRYSYSYTLDGTLASKTILNENGTEIYKTVFRYPYDGVYEYADKVAYPIDLESESNDIFSKFVIAPDSYDEYVTDDMTGELTFLAAYNYVYQNGWEANSVMPAIYDGDAVSVRSTSGGRLMLDGIEPGSTVRVYSTVGTLLLECRYDSRGIDLSGIGGGTYCVATGNGSLKVKM